MQALGQFERFIHLPERAHAVVREDQCFGGIAQHLRCAVQHADLRVASVGTVDLCVALDRLTRPGLRQTQEPLAGAFAVRQRTLVGDRAQLRRQGGDPIHGVAARLAAAVALIGRDEESQALCQSYGLRVPTTSICTRRFWARPSTVALSAAGCFSPLPSTKTRFASVPPATR